MEKIRLIINNINKKELLLSFILVFTPLITVFLYILLTGQGIHLKSFIPVNVSDEFYWWIQIDSVVKYGKPLGYFGYNESKALIGNLGAWSYITYYFYAFIGKIIGWNYYSMVWVNWIMLCFAMFIFLILVKPNNKQKIYASLVYLLCGIVTTYYSVLSMSDSCRCAFGIIMISFIIYLIKNRNYKKWVIIPCGLVSFIGPMLFYPFIIFSFFIVLLLLKNMNDGLKCLLSGIASLVLLILSFKINRVFQAKYFIPNNIDHLLESIKSTDGILNIIILIVNYLFNSIFSFFAAFKDGGQYNLFYVFYLVILIVVIIEIFIGQKDNRKVFVIVLISMIGYWLGNILLYTSSFLPKLMRILGDSLLPILLMISQFISKKYNRLAIILSSFLIVPFISITMKDAIISQYNTSLMTDQINALKDTFTLDVFEIKKENSEWENTIVEYGLFEKQRSFLLAVPSGCGLNLMNDWMDPHKSRYALIEKGAESENYLVETLPTLGYYLIYEDSRFYVYRNVKFDKT